MKKPNSVQQYATLLVVLGLYEPVERVAIIVNQVSPIIFSCEIKVTKTPVELIIYYTTKLNIFSHAWIFVPSFIVSIQISAKNYEAFTDTFIFDENDAAFCVTRYCFCFTYFENIRINRYVWWFVI